MARIPLPGRGEMTPAQQAVHDTVVSGPRGVMIGPLRAAIHNPDLAARWSALGEILRFGTTLPKRITELAILVTGRRWTSQIEFLVHAKAAAAAGVSAEAIEAIRQAKAPSLPEDEAEAYEFARQLQETGQVPLAAYKAIEGRWGARGVVELTAVIGYYTMVSMTLNAHEIPLPEGEAKALETMPGPALVALPGAV
jgi:4-carboxymuconolactone decarboxylase